jgi:RNA polymerase sigma factor (sigma-70 family)
MRDSEVVASIVAGEAVGLAEAYDRYANSLYKYCRSTLGDPADAAHAVQDTFVIAATRLAELPDAERLRAWLYAVARNECLRILRARPASAVPAEAHDEPEDTRPAQPDGAPDVTGDGAGDGDPGELARLRALIEDALPGLNPAEREVIELHLWQGLLAADIGAVLGVPQSQAQSLLSGATDQLEACLAVLVVGRAGPAGCAELARMLAGWDGRLTPELRWWVHPHIKRCGTCSGRRAVELGPSALLGLSPGAALAAGAAESLRAADGPAAALRDHTLALAGGQSPSAIAHRAAVLERTGPSGPDGFPKPLQAPNAGLLRAAAQGAWLGTPRRQAAAAAAGTVLAVAVVAVGITLTGNSGHGPVAGGKPPATGRVSPVVTASTPGTGSSAPAGSRRASAPASPRASSAPAASPTGAGVPTGTQPPTVAPTTSVPTQTPSQTATAAPTPPPSPTPAPSTSRPAPPPSPAPTPTAGTLSVSPPGGSIPPGWSNITLTARGGTVNWSISVSSGPGTVQVWPSQSGTLPSGGRTAVTVFILASHRAAGRRVTVNPGGTVFTISRGHPFAAVLLRGDSQPGYPSRAAAPRTRRPVSPSTWAREADTFVFW